MLLDCKTLKCEQIPIDTGDYSFVIINTNKPHALVESKYNERRQETEYAYSILKRKLDINCLADVKSFQLLGYRKSLPSIIYKRAKHVVDECERVEYCAEAMRAGNMKKFGELLTASHVSLAELYEVTGKELDSLAHAAWSRGACLGARMTGAGFGGCTINLVRTNAVEDFKKKVCERYYKETGYEATCYDVEISDGLCYKKI